jgi:hypothetical protein
MKMKSPKLQALFGHLDPSIEGQIVVYDKHVAIELKEPMDSLCMPPRTALRLALGLLQAARVAGATDADLAEVLLKSNFPIVEEDDEAQD